jgi:hypothetical protein
LQDAERSIGQKNDGMDGNMKEDVMTKISKGLIPSCAALGLAFAAHAPAIAQEQTLRFNHVLGPGEPHHAGFLKWAERVKERTKGGLMIEVFHTAQLGVEEDIIEQIRQGANIGQNTDSARLGGSFHSRLTNPESRSTHARRDRKALHGN